MIPTEEYLEAIRGKTSEMAFIYLESRYRAQLNDEQRTFYRNYKILLQNVERAKISICKSKANWDLNADLTRVGAYPISVPVNPFEQGGAQATLRLDASKIRRTYEDKIWFPKLRQAVTSTIEGAKSELGSQGITIVLLSGGHRTSGGCGHFWNAISIRRSKTRKS
jgi:hypothetical protein